MEDKKTLYTWCMLNNVRPIELDLVFNTKSSDDFMLKPISVDEFKKCLETGIYKKDSIPRKPNKFLELRMYGLVPYNISPIQQAIQFGHAVVRYSREHNASDLSTYSRWADNWETFIILNGGTSSEKQMVKQGYKDSEYTGSMQEHLNELKVNNIKVSAFYEPDLNSMLSAICFIVDERVFNRKLYPDYAPSPLSKDATISEFNEWSKNDSIQYAKWVEKIGGPKNEFLRVFLSDKRLA